MGAVIIPFLGPIAISIFVIVYSLTLSLGAINALAITVAMMPIIGLGIILKWIEELSELMRIGGRSISYGFMLAGILFLLSSPSYFQLIADSANRSLSVENLFSLIANILMFSGCMLLALVSITLISESALRFLLGQHVFNFSPLLSALRTVILLLAVVSTFEVLMRLLLDSSHV